MSKFWAIFLFIITVYTARIRSQTLTMSPSTNPLSVIEGRTVTLTVTSDQEMSQFQWSHNDTLKKTDTSSQTGSSFRITNASESDGGEYKCTGTPVNGSSVFVKKTIDIQYIKTVSITPSYRPYVLSIYQTNITLNCKVDGNPTPSIKWTKGSSTTVLTTSANYLIRTVQKSTTGTYKCSASNTAGSQMAEVKIIVHYGPEITPLAKKNIVEGHDLLVTCSVNAEPKPSRIWWTKNDNPNFSREGSHLNLTDIKRQMNGTYLCQVKNTIHPSGQAEQVKSSNARMEIDVTYGPDNSIYLDTQGNTRSLTLTENIPADKIQCSSVCNPSCSHSWSKQSTSLSFSNPLTLTPVSKTKAGIYRCTAGNTVSSNYTELNVTVLYSPTVEFSIDGGQNKMEGEMTNFRCTVDSNPKADIIIRSIENETFNLAKDDSSALNATIVKAECLNSGSYQCSANNSIGGVANGITNLFVHCKPRLDYMIYDNDKIFEETIEHGGNINITIDLIAYPKPEVRWIFRNEEGRYIQLSDIGHPNVNMSAVSQLMMHSIRFTLINVTNSDYGEYSAVVVNDEGNTVVTYRIMKKAVDSDNKDLPIILGGVFGTILFLIILSIVIVFSMQRKGIILKGCRFCEKDQESEDNGPVYANQSFSEFKNDKNDAEQESAEASINTHYEKTIPTMVEEHPYESSRSHNKETDYANWKAGAAKLNTDEGVYANIKAKEQTAQGNHNDSTKGLYENTEPVLKPQKHKNRRGK